MSVIQAARDHQLSLRRREAEAFRRMQSAYGLAREGVLRDLRRLLDSIGHERPSPAQLFRLRRYRELLREVDFRIAEFGGSVQSEIVALQRDALGAAAAHGAAYAREISPQVSATWTRLPAEAFSHMVGFLADGAPLASLLDELPVDARAVVRSGLTEAMAQGWNPRKTARAIRHGLNGSLVRAMRIARTEQLRAYRFAAIENYKANGRVVDGWVWVSVLDERTCPVCWAMHGSFWSLSTQFASHIQCRCAPVPHVAGVDNAVFGKGPELFEQLSDEKKIKILGRKKLELYRKGAPLEAFVKRNIDPRWGLSRMEVPARDVRPGREIEALPAPPDGIKPVSLTPDQALDAAVQEVGAVVPAPQDGRVLAVLAPLAPGHWGLFTHGHHRERAIIAVNGLFLDPAAWPMVLAHEAGHAIEAIALSAGLESGVARNPLLARWRRAVRRTPEYQALRVALAAENDAAKVRRLRYLLDWSEIWARAYAQWLARRRPEVERILFEVARDEHWGDENFREIDREMSKLLGRMGLDG